MACMNKTCLIPYLTDIHFSYESPLVESYPSGGEMHEYVHFLYDSPIKRETLTSLVERCMKISRSSTPCSTVVTVSKAEEITLVIITSRSFIPARNLQKKVLLKRRWLCIIFSCPLPFHPSFLSLILISLFISLSLSPITWIHWQMFNSKSTIFYFINLCLSDWS